MEPSADGDELQIGRYTLHVIERPAPDPAALPVAAGHGEAAGPAALSASSTPASIGTESDMDTAASTSPTKDCGRTTSRSCWRRFFMRAAASKIRLIPELSM